MEKNLDHFSVYLKPTQYCKSAIFSIKKNRHLFLTVLEAGKSKISVLADLLSGEVLFPGLQAAAFTLYPERGGSKIVHVPSSKEN